MFTGIIEETGNIKNIQINSAQKNTGFLTIGCKKVIEDVELGDSISVNGVCLTVTSYNSEGFTADISSETIKATSFKNLKAGSLVNLERAIKANGRFGGHIVSGHIDGVARCIQIINQGDFYNLELELKPEHSKYAINKGSIAIDGISLTIVEVNQDRIKLAIIPHTFKNTNLNVLKEGGIVNIEVDLTAKYIEKFLSSSDNKSRITLEFLQEHGF